MKDERSCVCEGGAIYAARSQRAHQEICSANYQALCGTSSPRRGPGLGNQLLKAGTSVGAHYREACRAKSDADFISKMEGALQELDETAYWLELIGESEILPMKRLESLTAEAEELTAILVTIVTKVKRKARKRV